jgi:hypothetical protein
VNHFTFPLYNTTSAVTLEVGILLVSKELEAEISASTVALVKLEITGKQTYF